MTTALPPVAEDDGDEDNGKPARQCQIPTCRKMLAAGKSCTFEHERLMELRGRVEDGELSDWSEEFVGHGFAKTQITGLTITHAFGNHKLAFLHICAQAERAGFAWGNHAGTHRGLPFHPTHRDFPQQFRNAFDNDNSAA